MWIQKQNHWTDLDKKSKFFPWIIYNNNNSTKLAETKIVIILALNLLIHENEGHLVRIYMYQVHH